MREDNTLRGQAYLDKYGHGRFGSYTYGECRCAECRAANAEHMREYRATKKRRQAIAKSLPEPPDNPDRGRIVRGGRR